MFSRLAQADNVKNSLPPAAAPKINTNVTTGHTHDKGIPVRAAWPNTSTAPPQRQLVDLITSNLPGGSMAAAYLQPVADSAAQSIKDYFTARKLTSNTYRSQLADATIGGSVRGMLPVLAKNPGIGESGRANVNR